MDGKSLKNLKWFDINGDSPYQRETNQRERNGRKRNKTWPLRCNCQDLQFTHHAQFHYYSVVLIFKLGIFLVHSIEVDTSHEHVYLSQ